VNRDRLIFALALGVCIAVVAGLMLAPRVEQALAPELVGAHVAIEIDGSGVAAIPVAEVEVESGVPVTLHAVLEGRRRDGTPIYYTEAPALRLGTVDVDPSALSRWDRSTEVKVRWFTIEPARTEIVVRTAEDFDALRFEPIFRPDWPIAWSVPLTVDPKFDDGLDPERRRLPFGTVRVHVRVELFGPEQQLVPIARYASAPAEAVATGGTVPTVVVSLPERLRLASAAFGLTHLSLETSEPGVLGRAAELAERRRASSLPQLLGSELRRRGLDPAEARWVAIDFIEQEMTWSETGVGPGSVVRVGGRAVFLLADANANGRLDPADLCLDFDRGAAVRPLAEVFGGGGAVELLDEQPSSAGAT
jgi:hypothetical protein